MSDKNINLQLEIDNEINDNSSEDIDFSKMNLKQKIKEIKQYKKKLRSLYNLVIFLILIIVIVYGISLFYESRYKQLQLNSVQQFIVSNVEQYIVPYIQKYILKEAENSVFSYSINDIFNKGYDYVIKGVEDYIDTKGIGFFEKYNNFKSFINNLIADINKKNELYNKLKKDLRSYAYLPKEVDDVLGDTDIQNVILTIESIKLYVIGKQILEYTSEFEEFFNKLGLSRQYSQKYIRDSLLDLYSIGGDSLIRDYLEDKLFNKPTYFSQDFKLKFFKYLKGTSLDYKKQEIYKIFNIYVDKILSVINNSLYPPIVIIFNSFDPKTSTMSFKMEVNTSLDKNYNNVDPYTIHINKIVSVINLLRGSYLIIGDNINIKKLKITIKKDKYNKSKKYLNSSFTFRVKLQRKVEREIYDLIYNK